MKRAAGVLLTVFTTGLGPPVLQEPPRQEDPPPQDAEQPVPEKPLSRSHKERERLTQEIEGSWLLMDFLEPNEEAFDTSALRGFATFDDGFLTMIIEAEALERPFLGRVREYLFAQAGAYRYRIDDVGKLQTSSVMSFTNLTGDGVLRSEPGSQVGEYEVRLSDGELVLRNETGGVLTFSRVQAGKFPESAVQKLEKRRSKTDVWEEEELEPR